MNRRRAIQGLVAFGTVALAGCSSIDESPGEAEYVPTVDDHLAVAVGNSNLVVLAIREFQDTADPLEAGFSESKPRERLEDARNALDAAEFGASDSDRENVDAVREYVTLIGETLDAVIELLGAVNDLEAFEAELLSDSDGESAQQIDEPSGVESDKAGIDFEAAGPAIARARSQSIAAKAAITAAEQISEAVDSGRLDAVDAELREVASGLERLGTYVSGVDGLTLGYDAFLDGLKSLDAAETSIDSEAFEQAQDAFETAVSSFESASAEFDAAKTAVPERVETELDIGSQRSTALARFATGHDRLLDGRHALKNAEQKIDSNAYDDARQSLNTGSEAAADARTTFNQGANIRSEEFQNEFATALDRAAALDSLSDGYSLLLDARDHAEAGEQSLLDERYTSAELSFELGTQQSREAREQMESGRDGVSDTFEREFDDAIQRAQALGKLTEGYARMVGARDDIESGEISLQTRDFAAAKSHFEAGASELDSAEQLFRQGSDTVGEEFEAEFERALCQVSHYQAAVAHFESAAVAGQAGDYAAISGEIAGASEEIDLAEAC